MDVRESDHPTEAGVDAAVGVDQAPQLAVSSAGGNDRGAANGAGSVGPLKSEGEQQLARLIRFRDTVRRTLHEQLDDLLETDSKSVSVQSLGGTTLDELCVDAMKGYGIAVSVKAEHVQAPGRAVEDPSVTEQLAQPEPLIHLVP